MLTYGFYNSLNHDRRYDAIQMSSIFDGIIKDGIFMSIGDRFQATASGSDMIITIGTGRAWFDHTWTLNDALLPIVIPESELILNRIDAIVLEVNAEVSVRANSIKVIKGTPSSNPVKPTLTKTATVHQYALAYITVKAGVTMIRQADISSQIGMADTPYVTGILETINIEDMVRQWEDQWRVWFESEAAATREAYLKWAAEWDDWYAKYTEDMTQTSEQWKTLWETWYNEYTSQNQKDWTDWKNDEKTKFEQWFADIQAMLDGDVAGNLADRITDLESRVSCLEQFKEDLITEYTVYGSLRDSDNEKILDSDGNVIQGRTIFTIK